MAGPGRGRFSPWAPRGSAWNASYANASEPWRSRTRWALPCCRSAMPCSGGMLVFFPSFRLMSQLLQRWRGTGLLTQIGQKKAVFEGQPPSTASRDSQRPVGGTVWPQFGYSLHTVRGKVWDSNLTWRKRKQTWGWVQLGTRLGTVWVHFQTLHGGRGSKHVVGYSVGFHLPTC